MPLIKRDTPSSQTGERSASEHLADLRSPDTDTRWRAARALGENKDAVAPLAAALELELVPRVREAIVTALVRIGDRASVTALLPYLRSQDASLRTTTIDALQVLPDVVHPCLQALLADEDSDVRILATELARNMSPAVATEILSRLIEREEHPNVCGAAVEVLTEVGTPAALPALRECALRFAHTPFLPFAIATAIARISAIKAN
jgi:HEAT repeat protein